ncbi:hypothetical protein [Desulfospira joergensenii]|uniref:hypothetical protein n=1 Tax=Desulfospira joergensenii TaxID=53329 RepID=UPI0003B6FF77|nr:hypothetical protein [Desulfospira joergensenii]
MMKVFYPKKSSGTMLAFLVLSLLCILPGRTGSLDAKTVKTSYKQYSIFAFEGKDFLCEPYIVKKDDWLYKIFRQKGEISEKDFPFFLKIFKSINPDINNIDAILPGINILIPLKRINKKSYEQDSQGIVEVPVVEFSSAPEPRNSLSSFITEHTVQPGDTVSELLDSAFLKKGGGVSAQGKEVFSRLNPDVKDIDIVYRGSRVKIPDPAILSQSWFESFLEQGTTFMTGQNSPALEKQIKALPVVQEHKIQQLKRYASLIQGTIINQGTMHFPGKPPLPDVELDLSRTPVIETGDQGRILILPRENSFDDLLLQSVKSYWAQLKTMGINQVIHEAETLAREQGVRVPASLDDVLGGLLPAMGLTYHPEEKVLFSVENIEMSALLGRIIFKDRADLLINAGKVFGLAIDALTKRGYDVLFVSPDLTAREICVTLLAHLGYTTWEDPPFTRQGMVETISGIYALGNDKKLFISWTPLDSSAQDFLTSENIDLIQLN